MKDIEYEVYTALATKLRAKFPKIHTSGEYVNMPASFPHVSIVEQDNYAPVEYLTNDGEETHSHLMYEINVYSNLKSGKKKQAKDIMNVLDREMYNMNFVRTSLSPVPNRENTTIYRLVARYEAVTDGENTYRR